MITVLILEADPRVRSILEDFLSKMEGFDLTDSVASISEAKDSLEEEIPDIIISDLHFQDGDVLDWIAQLRGENVPLDFIPVTADKNYATFMKSMYLGAVDYILKPFTFLRFKEGLFRYRVRKDFISPDHPLEQRVLDEFFFAENVLKGGAPVTDETKNFSKHTYDMIYQYVKERSDKNFTAQEVADALGVSRITARRYLELLEKEKVLEVELQYGKVGRPKNKYRFRRAE